VWPERLGKLKNIIHIIGTRTRDLSACGIADLDDVEKGKISCIARPSLRPSLYRLSCRNSLGTGKRQRKTRNRIRRGIPSGVKCEDTGRSQKLEIVFGLRRHEETIDPEGSG
jgi:hypothetical protein